MSSIKKINDITVYLVDLPKLSEEEKKFIDSIIESAVRDFTDAELSRIFLVDEKKGEFIHDVKALLSKVQFTVYPHERDLVRSRVEKLVAKYIGSKSKKIVDLAIDYLFGFGRITPLLLDPDIEEIMINGESKPVFVAHRSYGMCRTNIVYDSREELELLAERILNMRKPTRPIIDGSLEDGSRFSLVLPPVSHAPTITIRKFTSEPFSIAELVLNGTMSIDLAAFLWMAVEGMKVRPSNILIAGGAGSGKTTTLNALIGFIPSGERIVTIEDTPELNLAERDNVVRLYSYYDSKNSVSLADLVKASLRLRPDRIIVGEVRGSEAESMFTAMDVGCSGSMGTIHANSAKEVIKRLKNKPMNVPETLIPLLDIILVQHRVNVPGKGIVRRIVEVTEVDYLDKITLNTIYRWDRESDSLVKSDIPPTLFDKLSSLTGLTKLEIMDELEKRKRTLKNALNRGIKTYNELYPEISKDLSSRSMS